MGRAKTVLAVAAMLLAGVALAQVGRVALQTGQRWFVDGVFFGPRAGNAPAQARNALEATYESALVSHDFAALATGACADGPTVTVTGAALKDACLVSLDQEVPVSTPNLVLGCRVAAANAAVFRACAVGTAADGGLSDLPDAGYTVRTYR